MKTAKKKNYAMKIGLYTLLGFFIVIGAWFRLEGILNGSFSFTYDIGRDLLAVEDIVRNHNVTLIGPTTGLEGMFYGPWWYYFLAIPYVLTDGNPQGIALCIAILGIANILLGFLVGTNIGGKYTGISMAGFITFSIPLIGASSNIWSPNLVPTLVLISIFLLHKLHTISTAQQKNWFFLGLTITLAVETGIIFGILFSLSVVLACVLFLKVKMIEKRFLSFILGIFLIELPRILFELRNNMLMTESILGFSTSSETLSASNIFARENFIEIQSIFEKLWVETIAGEEYIIGRLFLLFLLAVFFLYYRKATTTEKFFLQFTMLTVVIFIVAFIFFPYGLWSHYLVGLPILFILFASIILDLLKRHLFTATAVHVLLVALFITNINPLKIYYEKQQPPWVGDSGVYRNYLVIIDYVYNEANGEDFKYVVYTPPVHDYTYRYLFPWYGKKKYGKAPSDKGAKLAFFIIEPDDDYPDRIKFWLRDREGDGKIIKKKIVQSGVIVQTRAL